MKSKRFYLYLIMVVIILLCAGSLAFSEENTYQPVEASATTEAPPALPTATMNEMVTPLAEPAVNAETPSAVIPSTNMEVPMTEEAPKVMEPSKATEAKPVAEESKDIKWVWGEVTLVDAANNKIAIKYLNYDTDVEETLNIVIESSTRFENAGGINAVKAGDNVGVDYLINAKGEATAKSIALEKAESMPEPEKTEAIPNVSTEEKVETPAAKVPQEAAPPPQVNAVEAPTQK